MVELSIALGIGINLVLTELFGFTSAGLVVPGYLALYLDQPFRILATLVAAICTWAVVKYALARFVVLYGRRRLAVAVLVGFVLNGLVQWLAQALPTEGGDLRIIGYIVPGIIANEALSQGLTSTLAATLLVAVVVRLLLFVILGFSA